MRRKDVNMLEGNLWLDITMYTIPVIISSILQLLFNAIDMIVIGKYSGSASMAAVSSTGSLVNLIINLFIGLSVGSTVCIARRIGRRQIDEIGSAVQTSITIAVFGGVFLMIVGLCFCKVFLQLMGSPADVIDLSTLYLRCYFLGMPGTMIYNFGAAVLKAKGDTRRPLIALSIAGLSNALLNLLFVTKFHLDVIGVGLASAIAAYISAGFVLYALIKDESFIHLDIKGLKIDKDAMKEILRVGLPAGLQSTLFSFSNVAIQSSVNSFGKTVMAANGAAGSVGDFVYVTMNSFSQSCLTFTSQNVGAGQLKRARNVLIVCLCLVSASGLILGNLVCLCGQPLLGIYSNDPEVIAAGMVKLSIYCRPYFLCGTMDVLVGALRGLGCSIVPMIVSLLGVCAFRLVWIATYFKAHHTIGVLYFSYPLSWMVTTFIHLMTFVIYYNIVRHKTEKMSDSI